MREDSTQAVELGSFIFFYFFCFVLFFWTFFFPRQVEYIAEYCRRSETARERERERERERKVREREKETDETERSDSKKSLRQGEEKS
jgi:hypothetical protein